MLMRLDSDRFRLRRENRHPPHDRISTCPIRRTEPSGLIQLQRQVGFGTLQERDKFVDVHIVKLRQHVTPSMRQGNLIGPYATLTVSQGCAALIAFTTAGIDGFVVAWSIEAPCTR